MAYIESDQQGHVSGSDINARPMSAEISKMMEELFGKRFKYNKT